MHDILRFSRCSFLVCAMAAALPGQTFHNLAGFNVIDGDHPDYESLVQGLDGNLYGTTLKGGANNAGTIFKITTAGALTTLHSFNGTDGGSVSAGLVLGADGNFYGTTGLGGALGHGTIFKITPEGVLTTLHSFNVTDGAGHIAGLMQSANGSLYGTASEGGTSSNCSNGCGAVFKITTNGAFSILHSFDMNDGAEPYAGVIQAGDGNSYGTTLGGGVSGRGTIFKITAAGALTTLYSFTCTGVSCPAGFGPSGGLVQGSDGNFYGTTAQGGAAHYGTVFKITPGGTLTTLSSLDGTNGMYPYAGLVQATDGNFYGTTAGAPYGMGTIFEIAPGGTLTVLYSFVGNPHGGLLQATDGNFYGTTYGFPQYGTVFALSTGLRQFVMTVPASGKTGAVIRILGTGLAGATRVTFNGVDAAFTVQAASEITAVVPAGATTGQVEVSTPGGVLISNVAFRVR